MATMKTTNFRRAVLPVWTEYTMDHATSKTEDWKKFFTVEKGRKANHEEETGLTGLGLPGRVGESEGMIYDQAKEGLTTRWTYARWKLAIRVSEDLIDDNDHFHVGNKYAAQIGDSLREGREIFHHAFLNNAFDSADAEFIYADGKPLIANDHPLVGYGMDGETWSNELTPSDISEASIEEARTRIRKLTNERGHLAGHTMRDLVVPTEQVFAANRILKSELQPGSNLNDINVVQSEGVVKNILELPRLEDSKMWFVRTSVQRSFVHKKRKGVYTGTDGDFETGDVKYMAGERYGATNADRRGWFGNQGV